MKDSTQYSEIETKYSADHVEVADFVLWAKSLQPFSKKKVEGYDAYYRQGKHVVRHRHGKNYNCLTVKYRKSADSIKDRVEVDMFLEGSQEDATEWLKHTGFVKEFTIWKDAHIFHVTDEDHDGPAEISLVIYDIKPIDGIAFERFSDQTQRFIEVEIEKSAKISRSKALKILSRWDKQLQKKFKLEAPLNKSLYEFYGKRQYRIGGKNV